MFLYLPAIVGVTPRAGELASLLSEFGDFEAIKFEEYARWKPKGYPATLVLPLLGVNGRVEKFLDNLDTHRICADLYVRAVECREAGYEKVICIGHSLGAGLAAQTAAEYQGCLDGIIGISPVFSVPRKPVPKFANLQRVRSLLILGNKDAEYRLSLKMASVWKEFYPDAVRIEKIVGAQHAFDQLLLRGGGRIRNPQYSAAQTAQADNLIKEWVKSFIS